MPDGDNDASGKQQDPRVEQLRPDPAQPPVRGRTFVGLWGTSDRDGFRRLYLTRDLTSYAEFHLEDVLGTVDIPPERSPFLDEQATRVELRSDAEIELTESHRVGDIDEFDLDVRFGTGAPRPVADVYASSGMNRCLKRGEPITIPCDYSCDWICRTHKNIDGRGRPDGGGPGGGRSADCWTDTCNTCAGATQCGTCNTDPGLTQCGTCYTEYGYTQCGTCNTDLGYTNCGGCDRVRR